MRTFLAGWLRRLANRLDPPGDVDFDGSTLYRLDPSDGSVLDSFPSL